MLSSTPESWANRVGRHGVIAPTSSRSHRADARHFLPRARPLRIAALPVPPAPIARLAHDVPARIKSPLRKRAISGIPSDSLASWGSLGSAQPVEVDREPYGLHLFRDPQLPALARINRYVDNPVEVSRQLDPVLVEGADPLTAEFSDEKAELKHDVLSSPRLGGFLTDSPVRSTVVTKSISIGPAAPWATSPGHGRPRARRRRFRAGSFTISAGRPSGT